MTVTLSPASRLVTKAKLTAKGWMPYLSHVLSSMRTYIGNDVPTMAVDDVGRLYINEEWVQKQTPKQLAYVLLHEVLHVVLSHARRRKLTLPNPDPQDCFYWNVAADLCIQQMLARHHSAHEIDGSVKITGDLNGIPFLSIPGLTRGMTTEAYYGILSRFFSQQQPEQPKPVPGGQPKPADPDGEGEQDGNSPGQQGEQGEQGEQQPGGSDAQPLDPRNPGSGSDGMRRPYEKPSRLAEQAMMESKLREVEAKADEHESSNPGSVPGELRQALNARLHPQPDPFDQLRSVVARSVASPLGADEHTYRRLNRRQPNNVARLRGVVRFAPECSVILDTSGSMCGGNTQDRAFNAVAQGLRKVQRPRVVQFDTRVHEAKRLSSMRQFHWCGGGGTDMAEAIEQEDRGQHPDAIVLITDGETGWPAKQPRARVIVALCKKSSWERDIPKWAKVVRCYEEGPKYAG